MLEIDAREVAAQLTVFIKASLARAGFAKAVVALSGGVDSATSGALAVAALGAQNLYPVLLPYGELGREGVGDARTVIGWLKIPASNVTEIDIAPLVDPILALDPAMDQIRRGNVMARVRMTVLFDQAKRRNALVVGTENKSEHLLGYYTRFGDEASDVEPLRGLYKTQVYELARFLGIPEQILAKPPTAGLWERQTDEGELGFSYDIADKILSSLYNEGKTVQELVAAGFDQAVVGRVCSWVEKNAFKQNLPIVPST